MVFLHRFNSPALFALHRSQLPQRYRSNTTGSRSLGKMDVRANPLVFLDLHFFFVCVARMAPCLLCTYPTGVSFSSHSLRLVSFASQIRSHEIEKGQLIEKSKGWPFSIGAFLRS